MNKDAIHKTAIVTWDKENGFIVESPLCPDVSGVDDTEEGAWKIFNEILEDYYIDYLAGRLAKPVMGRPPKGKMPLHTEVAPDIKASLAKLAKEKGISQGEAIEFLFGYWNRMTTKSTE